MEKTSGEAKVQKVKNCGSRMAQGGHRSFFTPPLPKMLPLGVARMAKFDF